MATALYDYKSKDRPSRLLVGTLTLAVCVNFLVALAFGPFLPYIASELSLPIALVGQIPGAITLGAGFLGFLVGPVAERLGYRVTVGLGVAGVAVSAAVVSLAQGFVFLIVGATIAAIGRAIINPMAWTISGSVFEAGQARQRALGWSLAGVPLAGIVGIPLLSALGELFGWRSAFIAVTAGACVTAVLCVWIVPTLREAVANDESSATYADVWRVFVSGSAVRNLIGASLLSSAGTWTVWTYIGAFFAQQHSAGLQYVSAVYLVCGVGLLVGNVVVARLLRHRAPLRVLLICRLAAAILYGLALSIPLGAVAATAVLATAMFCVGTSQVVTADMLVGASTAGRATVLAVNGSALSLGAALGAGLGGAALALGGYAAISGCAGLVSVLGVVALARTRVDAIGADVPRAALGM